MIFTILRNPEGEVLTGVYGDITCPHEFTGHISKRSPNLQAIRKAFHRPGGHGAFAQMVGHKWELVDGYTMERVDIFSQEAEHELRSREDRS